MGVAKLDVPLVVEAGVGDELGEGALARPSATTSRRSRAQLRAGAADAIPTRSSRTLAELAPARERAWDCATGSGQAALGPRAALRARRGDRRERAADRAMPWPRRTCATRCSRPRRPSFAAATLRRGVRGAGAALVRRRAVLRRGAARAAAGRAAARRRATAGRRSRRSSTRALERAVLDADQAATGRRRTSCSCDGYRDVPFPFEPVEFPALAIEVHWTLAQFIAYVGDVDRDAPHCSSTDTGFLDERARGARAAWGGAEPRTVTMPLHVRCGRHGLTIAPSRAAAARARRRRGGRVSHRDRLRPGRRCDQPAAVAKIFALKGRPADHPLIVHIADARRRSTLGGRHSRAGARAGRGFWPGPAHADPEERRRASPTRSPAARTPWACAARRTRSRRRCCASSRASAAARSRRPRPTGSAT